MSIVGIGTDIVEISRIKKQLAKTDINFAKNILTECELSEYESTLNKERFIAKRFAAKEAAVKALGTGFALGVSFKNIEITYSPLGIPDIKFYGEAKTIIQKKQVNSVHLSISDAERYTLAFVVFERIHNP